MGEFLLAKQLLISQKESAAQISFCSVNDDEKNILYL